jgi:UDP-N-acetylglucosamine acyltransferase
MPIAATAIVHPGARVHPSATIGDFCIIEDGVEVGAGCRLDPFAIVKRYTSLGEGNHLYSGAQLGTDPLDKKFREKDPSYLRIGSHNVLREYLTISRGTQPGSATEIGDHNYVMTNVHIAHNCKVGSHNTICSNTLIAGHVEIEDHCFLSGGVVVHQYSRIGRLAMIGGNTRVNLDIPPFLMISEFNAAARGLNLVGLRRYAMNAEAIQALKRAYRILYRSGLALEEALVRIDQEVGTPEARMLTLFVRRSERGIVREPTRSRDPA